MELRKRKNPPVGHEHYNDIGVDDLISETDLKPVASEAAAVPTPAKRKEAAKLHDAKRQQCLLGVEPTSTTAPPLTLPTDQTAMVRPMPGVSGFCMTSLQEACDHLSRSDPLLKDLIALHGVPTRLLKKNGPAFNTLARSIVFQQLATKAAATIFARTLEACKCEDLIHPEAVLSCELQALRNAGLSERKASYIIDLANRFQSGVLSDEIINSMDHDTLAKELVQVKGIGPWSVDMFSMFHLGAPDVLPVGDLGVRKGMQQLYGLKALPDASTMNTIASKWQPYRSVGSYFMWRVPVQNQRKAK